MVIAGAEAGEGEPDVGVGPEGVVTPPQATRSRDAAKPSANGVIGGMTQLNPITSDGARAVTAAGAQPAV